jgi:hypothetical protein
MITFAMIRFVMQPKKALLLSGLFLLTLVSATAQEKQYQAGFRMGVTSGFTGRAISNEEWGFEGMLGFRSGGAQLYGLLEARKSLMFPRADNFYFYYGAGAHIGFVGWEEYYAYEYYDPHDPWSKYSHFGLAFGIDGIAGLEYKFHSVPITAGVDFKPFFEFYGPFYFRVNVWDFAAGIRYTF